MNEEEEWDEDGDDPFEIMSFLGLGVCDQEEDDDEFEEEWDDDVHWACMYLAASALGDWGLFAEGLAWDGSRDPDYEPAGAELTVFDHIRLVLYTRSQERFNAQRL